MTTYYDVRRWMRVSDIARKMRDYREIDYPEFKTDAKAILLRNLCRFADDMYCSYAYKYLNNK